MENYEDKAIWEVRNQLEKEEVGHNRINKILRIFSFAGILVAIGVISAIIMILTN